MSVKHRLPPHVDRWLTIREVILEFGAYNKLPFDLTAYILTMIKLSGGDYNQTTEKTAEQFAPVMEKILRDEFGITAVIAPACRGEG